jgi:predicted nuclease of predicted toxin-antitoxin system
VLNKTRTPLILIKLYTNIDFFLIVIMPNLKILIDEMDDGWDEKLQMLGYDAFSVKKLRAEGKKLRTDYSVINYARENGMILVTRDTESGQACEENNLPYILLDNEEIFKIVLDKVNQLSSKNSN